jgi:hypothetical protein
LQQAGIAELGPYLSAYKNWKLRVYRDIWNIIQRYWTAERWIRVTDDQNVAQFFQINKQATIEYGRPAIVNAIGSLDVDIIIDEGPDAVNMQGDSMMVLQSLGPQFAAAVPGDRAGTVAAAQLGQEADAGQDQAKQSAPPPPDPKVMAQGEMKKMELAADAHSTAEDNSLEWRKASNRTNRRNRFRTTPHA